MPGTSQNLTGDQPKDWRAPTQETDRHIYFNLVDGLTVTFHLLFCRLCGCLGGSRVVSSSRLLSVSVDMLCGIVLIRPRARVYSRPHATAWYAHGSYHWPGFFSNDHHRDAAHERIEHHFSRRVAPIPRSWSCHLWSVNSLLASYRPDLVLSSTRFPIMTITFASFPMVDRIAGN